MRSTYLLALFLGLCVPLAFADDFSRRLPFHDSKVVGSPEPPTPYKTVRAFPKLTVKQPLALVPEPGTKRLFCVQHMGSWSGPGRIVAFEDSQETSEAELLIEIQGIAYGLAFHPKYRENGLIFVGMNGPVEGERGNHTKVVRYTVDRNTGKIDPKSALLIIFWKSDGHNGGDLAFGPDGFLYVTSGDGSSDSDRDLVGQTIDDLLAAMLRIDVDHPAAGKAYGIPKDNPFLDRPNARPELWAYGFRNPWRVSYDHVSNQLWVGNNGQDLWEQVYLVRKGANYGWSVSEGSHIFHAKRQVGPDPISPPAAEHHHSEARSLTGGQVYRGPSLPELVGTYVYGDWSTGKVWGVKAEGTKVSATRELVDTPFNITGFGTDHAGELYVFDQAGGTFQRFVRTGPEDLPKEPFPTKLSQTGLFADVAKHRAHPALLPYTVNAPAWNDGASAERLLALPGLEPIMRRPQNNAGGNFSLPDGSVILQTLSLRLAGKAAPTRVETRLMVRQQGEWAGYSYRWNEDQTDAELVSGAGDSDAFDVADPKAPGGRREQIWRFPSRAECLVCHSRAAGFVLGMADIQLNRDSPISSGNQLDHWNDIGVYETKAPKRAADTAKLTNPYDAQAPLEARAKAYLHVNCSSCHVEAGGGNAKMELGVNTPLKGMRLVDVEPIHDRFDLPDAKLVAPGSPEKSVLYQRLSRRGTGQMPPLMSTEVDREAVDLFRQWITGMKK